MMNPNLVRVSGVDLGFENLGLASAVLDIKTGELVVTGIKLVHTEIMAGKQVRKNSDDLRRCRELYEGFQRWVLGSACVFAEIPTGSQSAAGMKMCGLSIMLAASSPVPVIEVTPSETKLASVGNKTASKQQIITWAHDQWPGLEWIKHGSSKRADKLTNANEHAADACAIIKAGVGTTQFKQLTTLLASMAA